MSPDAVAVLIRQKHVVGTDGDEPGVTDFDLVMKLDQTLGLAPILRAESSPAKHQNHRIWPLKIGKLPTFARVIGQLMIGKYCASYNVRSHAVSTSSKTMRRICFLSGTRIGRERAAEHWLTTL